VDGRDDDEWFAVALLRLPSRLLIQTEMLRTNRSIPTLFRATAYQVMLQREPVGE